MKHIKRFLLVLILILTLCTNFNSYTNIISSKSLLEESYDYVQLSNFRLKGNTIKAGENIGYSCSFTLSQILGGYVSFKSDAGDTFNANFVVPSPDRYISIPSNVKPGKYYITEIKVGGTGRDGGMVTKIFTDSEIFKDEYLEVSNDSYVEPTSQVTSSSTTTSSTTTTSSSEVTSKVTQTTTKKKENSNSTSYIYVQFVLVIIGVLLIGGLLLFLKAMSDE